MLNTQYIHTFDLMKRTWTYSDTITIKSPIKRVKQFMANLKNIAHFHPYMISVEEIPVTGEEIKKYKGVDRFPIFLYYSKKLQYIIDLIYETDDNLLFKSSPGGGISLLVSYKFREGQNKDQCVVEENSQITGNIFMLPLAWKGLTDSHKPLMESIKWHLQQKTA